MDLYLFRSEQQTGPYTEADARELVVSGQIERTCPAWREGLPEWLPLEQLIDLPALPSRPTMPAGLPPVPTRSSAKTGASNTPETTTPSAAPEKPMKLGTKINVYGGHALWALGVVLAILRLLSGCHHR